MLRNQAFSSSNFLLPNFPVSWPPSIEAALYLKWVAALLICAFLILARRRLLAGGKLAQAGLFACAALALFGYTHFGTFHGRLAERPEYFHAHDIFHYYLGSKYFEELGYEHLYPAAMAALAEEDGTGVLEGLYYRRMSDYALIRAPLLGPRLAEFKALFAPPRWTEFRQDVLAFRDYFAGYYPSRLFRGLFEDHGYNPPPTYTMIAGALSSVLPFSESGLYVLASIDVLLLLGAFAAVAASFGVSYAALVLIIFSLNDLSDYSWIGGAFLRMLWFAALCGAVAALRAGRPFLGGAALGVSAAARGFPALALAACVFPLLWQIRSAGPRACFDTLRFVGAAVFTILLLAALSAFTIARPSVYTDWLRKTRLHGTQIAVNSVGLATALAFDPRFTTSSLAARYAATVYDPERFGLEEAPLPDVGAFINGFKRRVLGERLGAYVAVSALFVAALAAAARGLPLYGIVISGVSLIWAGPFKLSCYYYAFLALFPLVGAGRDRQLSGRALNIAVALLMLQVASRWIAQYYADLDAVTALVSALTGLFLLALMCVIASRSGTSSKAL